MGYKDDFLNKVKKKNDADLAEKEEKQAAAQKEYEMAKNRVDIYCQGINDLIEKINIWVDGLPVTAISKSCIVTDGFIRYDVSKLIFKVDKKQIELKPGGVLKYPHDGLINIVTSGGAKKVYNTIALYYSNQKAVWKFSDGYKLTTVTEETFLNFLLECFDLG